MLDKKLTIYKSLDLQKPALPKRSYLYSLEPLGVGTPEVECLTSYVTRLAEAHSVATGVLMLQEIIPLLNEQYEFKTEQARLNYQYGHMNQSRSKRALNGMGVMAASMVQVLEQLTLRSGLRSLTMLKWVNVLPTRGLLRPIRAWCPLCYYEWHKVGQVIRDPLIWTIEVVTVCPHHHQRLLYHCPHCHKPNRVWAWHLRPGYCSDCGEWLGISPAVVSQEVLSKNELKWQLWVVNNIGELLAASQSLSSEPPKARVTQNIVASVNQVAQGSISTFVRLLGKYKRSLREWHSGRQIPQLSNLLPICHFLEISLLDFLTGNIAITHLDRLNTQLQGKQQSSRRRPPKKVDSEKVRSILQAALEENPPPSMKDVLKRLDKNCSEQVYPHFPDLYSAILSRYAAYKKAKSQEEMRSSLEAVIERKEYPPPSMEEVGRRLQPDRRTLERNCPDLCRIIKDRYADYLKTSRRESEEQIRQEVRQAALKVHAEGRNPQSHTLAKLLTKPGVLRNKEAISALYEVRCFLGYEK